MSDTKDMNILAVVVLYYPDSSLMDNINSYLPYVNGLFVWDNTPSDAVDKKLIGILEGLGGVVYRGEGKNVGIGTALNESVEYSRKHGFTHILTLDQDSHFLPGDLKRYLEAIKEYRIDKEAIFSTNYFIKSQQVTYYPVDDSIVEVPSGMTSGSIYPVSIFDKLGLFMSELFVWGIDCEFGWRAKRKNIPTLCFRFILLQHDLGYQKKKYRLFGKEVFPNEYPPARSYYNVRNAIVLHKSYPDMINIMSNLKYHFFKRMVFVVLYEDRKVAKLKALWLGLLDGCKGRLGERKGL